MNLDNFKKKLDNIKELQTLPAIAMKVNKMVNASATTPEKLSLVIEKDQAIVAKLLRLVNSSFYGMPSRVSSIPDAIILLGYNTLRNIVMTVSVMGSLSSTKNFKGINPAEFWKHSLAVSSVSKHLSTITGIGDPDDCFTGGLLHDLGKIVLFMQFNEIFGKIMETAVKNDLTFNQTEKKLGIASHAEIGAYLAEKWRVPKVLVNIIKNHHELKNPIEKSPELIVQLSDAIVHCYMHDNIMGKKPEGVKALKNMHPKSITIMKSVIKSSTDWFPELLENIEESLNSFV